MHKFFEQGGPKFFVASTTVATREVRSHKHRRCELKQDWFSVLNCLSEMDGSEIHSAEIFTKPRLCAECMKHATQPEMFDIARGQFDCLCYIENDSRCDVHKKQGKHYGNR